MYSYQPNHGIPLFTEVDPQTRASIDASDSLEVLNITTPDISLPTEQNLHTIQPREIGQEETVNPSFRDGFATVEDPHMSFPFHPNIDTGAVNLDQKNNAG